MVDAIDPVAAKVNSGLVHETPLVEPVKLHPDRRQAPSAAAPAVQDAHAGRQAEATAREAMPRPGFEVRLDGATLRVYSEMRDPDTKKVLLRIPAGYQPKTEPPRDYAPTEIET